MQWFSFVVVLFCFDFLQKHCRFKKSHETASNPIADEDQWLFETLTKVFVNQQVMKTMQHLFVLDCRFHSIVCSSSGFSAIFFDFAFYELSEQTQNSSIALHSRFHMSAFTIAFLLSTSRTEWHCQQCNGIETMIATKRRKMKWEIMQSCCRDMCVCV